MKKTATLCLSMFIGCGGGSEHAREPTPPLLQDDEPTPAASSPKTETREPEEFGLFPSEENTLFEPTKSESTAPAAPAPYVPARVVARAELRSIPGNKPVGTLAFESTGFSISMSGQFSGLVKGERAIYIHATGDCGAKGRKARAHLNPTDARHGPPASAMRHAGDFGNLTVDKAGNAAFSMTTDSITLEAGRPDSVVGHAVIIHARKDDKQGDGGPAIACGVITLAGSVASTP